MIRKLLIPALALALATPVLASEADPLSPAERGELTRQFILKWGPYVQGGQGIPVRAWALRMVPTFVEADPANFRRALKRETFEGALAEFGGRGQRLTDEQVIDAHAAAGIPGRPELQAMAAKTLGSITNDLVFTPVTPCRIFDTRVAGGIVTAGATRSFLAVAISPSANFSSQGGSNTNCNVAAVGASAVVLNVTAVTPSNVGFTTVWKYGEARPLAAGITYNAGQLISNSVVVGIPNPLGILDISLYSSAQAHYVADIVGYFSPPEATGFDCTNTTVQSFTIAANSTNFFNNPACPAGYTPTVPYCWTAIAGVRSQGSGYNANSPSNATFCSWENNTPAGQTVFGGNVCCRVPGR